MIPFGILAPDQSTQNKNVATVADNVVNDGDCYVPLLSAGSTISTIATGGKSIRHAMSFRPNDLYSNGLTVMTTGILFYKDDNEFSGTVTELSGLNWGFPFVLWDDYLLIAGDGVTPPQKIAIADLAGATNTTNIGGSPPTAHTCAKVREFLVLGATSESSVEYYNRVRWSAFDDYDAWTAGTNQSDFQDLPSSGQVRRIVGGEMGIIFQEDAVTRMTYIGTPTVFQFDLIEGAAGTPAGLSVVEDGTNIYYLGFDGFYNLKDGSVSVPIGRGKIDKWFFENMGHATITTYAHIIKSVTGIYDKVSGCVIWAFSSTTNTAQDITYTVPVNDRLIIFNTKSGEWTTATISTSTICATYYNMDQTNDNAHQYGVALWEKSVNDQLYKFLNGSPLAGSIETGEISDGNYTTDLTEVRPLIDGTCTVTVDYRDELNDSVTSTSALSVGATGKADPRVNARYQRIKCTTSGEYTKAIGVETKTRRGGLR